VTTESDKVVLERHWFVVAHQNTLNSWKMSPPDFGAHVGQVSFENVVHELGGKNAFNRLVQRLVRRELGRDFYEEWIAPVKGAG